MNRFVIIAITLFVFASSAFAESSARSDNIAIVEDFLSTENIAAAMHAQGENPDAFLIKVRKLNDRKLAKLANHTKPLILAANDSNGASAERISTQWLNFAKSLVGIGIIAFIVLLLIII